jgi:hypothetical protein
VKSMRVSKRKKIHRPESTLTESTLSQSVFFVVVLFFSWSQSGFTHRNKGKSNK